MPAIGITGGIATGKTAFSTFLRELAEGARFFDADLAARELTKDVDVLNEIRGAFGDDVFDASGSLNRAAVRAIVFSDSGKKLELERILHPRIRGQWAALAEQHRNSSSFFFADIPLLYETGGETLCDRVAVVACSENVQLQRLIKRTGISEPQATDIIHSQMHLNEKITRAEHVIWNDGPLDVLKTQAQMLLGLWTKSYV